MGKDKRKEEAAAPRGGVSMVTKRTWRAEQSERDRLAATSAEGWVGSKKAKGLVDMKHRCKKCLHPSADCRRGAELCGRCSGIGKRELARKAQKAGQGGGRPQTAMAEAARSLQGWT